MRRDNFGVLRLDAAFSLARKNKSTGESGIKPQHSKKWETQHGF
jgi:hypothetical protein